MAYWTAAIFRTTVWKVTTDQVPDLIMNEAIASGEAELHAYLEREYSVPFDPVPDLIKGLAADIIRYRGQIRIGHETGHLQEPDKEAYKNAIALLEKIRAREMDIPGESRKSAVADGYDSNTKDYTPIMDVDDEINWEPDSDRLDSIAEDRD